MPNPTPRTRHRRRLTLLSITVALAAMSSPATAGTYTVHSCTTPSGTWTGMEGWTSSASLPTVGHDNGSATACSSPGGALSLQFGATGLSVAPGSWLRWTFTAPPSTEIRSASVFRAFALSWPAVPGVSNRPYAYHLWHDLDENDGLLDLKAPLQSGDTLTQDTPSVVNQDEVAWEALTVSLRCWGLVGSLDCGSVPAQVSVPRATIGLTDTAAPVTTVSGGNLAGGAAVRGQGVWRSMRAMRVVVCIGRC